MSESHAAPATRRREGAEDWRRKILGLVRMYGVACSNYADTKRRGDNGIYTAEQDAAIAEGYFAQITAALAAVEAPRADA